MADITPENPVTFDTSKTRAMISTGLRDVGIVVTFGAGLLGLIGKRDLTGIMAFMQSEQGITALSLVAGIALTAWRQWNARHNVKVVEAAVNSPPSDPAVILKGPASA